MDLSKIKPKLVGSDDERAVSPVIGVILMVAITVILAAVIAAFVLDMGDSIGQEAQAGVSIEVDEVGNEIQIEVTSLGNADYVNVTGSVRDESDTGSSDVYFDDSGTNAGWTEAEDDLSELGVGDVVTIGSENDGNADVLMGDGAEDSGTVTVIAVINSDGTETSVSSQDYDLTWSHT